MIRKYGYVWFLITIFAVIQPSILLSLNISIIVPDLVSVVIAALAFTRSIRVGIGFAIYAGILVDLISPATGIFGISVVGYLILALLINQTVQAPHQTTWLPVAAAGLAPALVVTVRAILVFLTSGTNLVDLYPNVLLWQLLVGVIAATFTVPIMDRFDRPLVDGANRLRVSL